MSQNFNEKNLKQKSLSSYKHLEQKEKKIFIHESKKDFIFCNLCPFNIQNQIQLQNIKQTKSKKQIEKKEIDKRYLKRSLKRNKSELLVYSSPINYSAFNQKKELNQSIKLIYSLNVNKNDKKLNSQQIKKSSTYKTFSQTKAIKLIKHEDDKNFLGGLNINQTNLSSFHQTQTNKDQLLKSIQTIDSIPKSFEHIKFKVSSQQFIQNKQNRYQLNYNGLNIQPLQKCQIQHNQPFKEHHSQLKPFTLPNKRQFSVLNKCQSPILKCQSSIRKCQFPIIKCQSPVLNNFQVKLRQPPVLKKNILSNEDKQVNQINQKIQKSVQSIEQNIIITQALQSNQLNKQQKKQYKTEIKIVNKTGKLDNFKLRKTVSLRQKQQSEDECSQVLVGNRKIGRYAIMSNIQQNLEQSMMTCMQKSANKQTVFNNF